MDMLIFDTDGNMVSETEMFLFSCFLFEIYGRSKWYFEK